MFKHLVDFRYQRNTKEAIGFYLAYFLLFILIGGLLGGATAILNTEAVTGSAMRAGAIFAVMACVSLYLVVMVSKKVTSFGYLLLAVVAGICAIFLGALLGLVPVAFLTTKKAK